MDTLNVHDDAVTDAGTLGCVIFNGSSTLVVAFMWNLTQSLLEVPRIHKIPRARDFMYVDLGHDLGGDLRGRFRCACGKEKD